MSSSRETARSLQKSKGLNHVVYGYKTSRSTVMFELESEMPQFTDDDSYVTYINQLQAKYPSLQAVYAVHN